MSAGDSIDAATGARWPIWLAGAVIRRDAPGATSDPNAVAALARLADDEDLLGGSALFETLLARGGRPVGLAAHRARLERSCRSLGRPDPPAAFERAAEGLAAALPGSEGALRLTLIEDGRAVLGTSRPLPAPPSEGTTLWVAPPSVRAGDPIESIKHASRVDHRRWRAAAREHGAWDALLLDLEGRPVEASVANLWFVESGRLWTPPIHAGCLPGVTRAAILGLPDPPLPTGLARPDLERLLRADEVLTSNCLTGPVGVRRILRGDRVLEFPGAGGSVVQALRRALDPGNPGAECHSGRVEP